MSRRPVSPHKFRLSPEEYASSVLRPLPRTYVNKALRESMKNVPMENPNRFATSMRRKTQIERNFRTLPPINNFASQYVQQKNIARRESRTPFQSALHKVRKTMGLSPNRRRQNLETVRRALQNEQSRINQENNEIWYDSNPQETMLLNHYVPPQRRNTNGVNNLRERILQQPTSSSKSRRSTSGSKSRKPRK
jgi:hypothetical protein